MDEPLHREHQLEQPVFGCHTERPPVGDVTICVHGEIDWLTAPTLHVFLDQEFTAPVRASGVEVALAHTTFIDARAISTLLAAAHTARGQARTFRVTGCSSRLLHVIDIVGLRELLVASRERRRHPDGDCPLAAVATSGRNGTPCAAIPIVRASGVHRPGDGYR
jgi:anti-anti-sigma factor